MGSAAEKGAALSDVALALNGLRRRTEAQPVFVAALTQLRAAHAGDHDDIAWLLNNQAWGLHAMGRLAEAAPLQALMALPPLLDAQSLSSQAVLDSIERAQQLLQQLQLQVGPSGPAALEVRAALAAARDSLKLPS